MMGYRPPKATLLGACLLLGLVAAVTLSASPDRAARRDDGGAPGVPTGEERRVALATATAWAPVFGGVELDELGAYDLVVVDGTPDRDGHVEATPADVARLRRAGTLVIAYVSIGTSEDWRAHTRDLPAEAQLAALEDWDGERYVDASHPTWQERILELARLLEDAGFDGLYLDNLDVAEDYPETASGVVALVTRLREDRPDLLLVAQNGLSVLERLPVDAVSHEDVFWRWDDGYRPSTDTERDRLLDDLRRARARGLPVFTVDYTEPGSPAAEEVVARSRAEGFRPTVTVLDLDRVPHAPSTEDL